MMPLDSDVFAERVSAVERHLGHVAERLPDRAEDLKTSTDAADAVILHLWQAVQIVIDLAVSLCVRSKLGAPASYADAFRKLADANFIGNDLASRLTRAAGFRNLVAHAYESPDMGRVFVAAQGGPEDLREFLRVVRDSKL